MTDYSVVQRQNLHKLRIKKYKKASALLCMSVPVFFIGVLFNYVPIWGWIIAFFDYSPGIPLYKTPFAGLKYFLMLFAASSDFPIAMRNTVVLSLLGLLVLPASLLLALLITEVRNNVYKKSVQIITSFPNFISWIITYSLVFHFLSVDDGIVNQLLLKLHLISQPVDFLVNPDYSWLMMTMVNLWKNTGYSAIIFLSAIAGISQELYQAAEVDGAGRFKKILFITLPSIMPTFAVLMILNIGQLLNLGFEQYYSFQNPVTLDRLEIIDTYVYRTGLVRMSFSFATAVGIFQTLISCGLLIMANGMFKKTMNKSIL